jgi:hypothetical protein
VEAIFFHFQFLSLLKSIMVFLLSPTA